MRKYAAEHTNDGVEDSTSTAIFLKICFQCSREGLPFAYAGRWVQWQHVPRVGDMIQWSEGWDDAVEAVYWHISENAVEIIVTSDCDSADCIRCRFRLQKRQRKCDDWLGRRSASSVERPA